MTKQKRFAWLSVVGIFSVLALVLGCACFTLFSERDWPLGGLAGPVHGHGLRPFRPSRASAIGQNVSAPVVPIIDPVLVYATFLGGPNGSVGGQQATAMLVDASGNVYVAGNTDSPSFPTTPGVVLAAPVAGATTFVSKIDPTGKTLIFSTYVPGLYELGGFALDTSGNIYVAGKTSGLTIPSGTTPYQTAQRSIGIVKLNSTATAVLNATYLGGSGANGGPNDMAEGIAVDSAGSVYVTGFTPSNDFPTLNALQGSLGTSGSNGFVSKLDSSLSTLLYSSYLGGSSTGAGSSIAVDSSLNAYVAGTASSGFPTTTSGVKATCSSNDCAYLAKLNPSATGSASLLYSTYLAENSNANVVTVDGNQNSYIGGTVTGGTATLGTCSGGINGYLVEINAAGAMPFTACLGYFQQGNARGVAALSLDASGTLYVAGSDDGLPLTNPIQTNSSNPVTVNSWVAAINPGTNSLLFSSLIGGAQPGEADTVMSVGADSNGNIYAAGLATSDGLTPPFPVFNALQPLPGAAIPCLRCGASDAFILKIAATNAPAAALTPAALALNTEPIGTTSSPEAVTIVNLGSAALNVSNATATGDFAVQNNCSTVAPAGGTCTINVTFTPTANGLRTGTLTITDNSAGSPRTVPLTGTGGEGTAQISPASLSFSNQAVGTTSAAQTVTLTNPGALPLAVSHIQAASPFAETNNCGTSVGVGLSCTISVTFAPTAAGSATGVLTFIDSASDSPQSVALTGDTGGSGTGSGGGSGTPPGVGLGVASGGAASATVTAGSTATYSLSIGGAGISGNASLSCTGAPTGSTCSVPNSVALSATTPSTFKVSVTTTARSELWLRHFERPSWIWAVAMIGCLALLSAASKTRSVRLGWALAPVFALTLCACGGGNSPATTSNPTPTGTMAGTYTIVVTAKSGSSTQSQNLTLIVQ
jgi:hypothetical protein